MIKTKNLTKKFGNLEAVSELSMEIAAGEVVGLLGPNGAGKTTTMRMLTTYLAPDGGSAEVFGFDVVKEADAVRKNIGYLPETPALYSEMTVLEYITFMGKIRGLNRAELRESVARVMYRCLLEDVAYRLCSVLSKGYRQRVGLAQALVHNPGVIILDEPTSGLDPSQIIEIRRLIKELGEEHTVILSTHVLPEVVSTCSRALIISEGSVVSEVTELKDSKVLEERYMQAVSTEFETEAFSEYLEEDDSQNEETGEHFAEEDSKKIANS